MSPTLRNVLIFAICCGMIYSIGQPSKPQPLGPLATPALAAPITDEAPIGLVRVNAPLVPDAQATIPPYMPPACLQMGGCANCTYFATTQMVHEVITWKKLSWPWVGNFEGVVKDIPAAYYQKWAKGGAFQCTTWVYSQ